MLTIKMKTTQIAKKLNVTSQCVSQWIGGKREPNLNQIYNLSKILNCSIDEIVMSLIAAKQQYAKKNSSLNSD